MWHKLYTYHNKIMRIKKLIYLLLYFYLFQIFLIPLAHYRHEIDEKDQCIDCHAGVQLNSSCGDQEAPCENPAHHHHNKHKAHDPAHCVVCKSLLQDIENRTLSKENFSQHTFVASYCNRCYGTYLLCASFSNRSPPTQTS